MKKIIFTHNVLKDFFNKRIIGFGNYSDNNKICDRSSLLSWVVYHMRKLGLGYIKVKYKPCNLVKLLEVMIFRYYVY
jgi:hypothetical protein